jgi:hypothetical protein
VEGTRRAPRDGIERRIGRVGRGKARLPGAEQTDAARHADVCESLAARERDSAGPRCGAL